MGSNPRGFRVDFGETPSRSPMISRNLSCQDFTKSVFHMISRNLPCDLRKTSEIFRTRRALTCHQTPHSHKNTRTRLQSANAPRRPLKEFGNVSCKANTTTVDKPMKASDTRTHGPLRSLRRFRSPKYYSATQLLIAPLLIGAAPPTVLCSYMIATV